MNLQEYRHKWGKIGPSHLLNENGDLSFLYFSKQCLIENIQGKFPKNSSVTFISEESRWQTDYRLLAFPMCLWRRFIKFWSSSRFILKTIRLFVLDFYLNNRVFLSRNYRLIVAPSEFDVFNTNICPRSQASRANMQVLSTSNFQGATIRPVVRRH